MRRALLLALLLPALGWAAPRETSWTFAVSGDSRDAGDIVMPAIAEGVHQHGARFYWHLGDFRHIGDFDPDMAQQHRDHPLTISAYEDQAWDDFIENELKPFAPTPVYLAIGNHEVTAPKTREAYLVQFADWLEQPTLAAQRLHDNPSDHQIKTWYHWQQGCVDFITLDDVTPEQLVPGQFKWFESVLQSDQANPAIKTVVVGMHEVLPDSLGETHRMAGQESGRKVYNDLLSLNQTKKVYILASHSHYYMANVFNTPYWQSHGGVLPGWIVGTAGAQRHPLPASTAGADDARTKVYGYLLGTVHPDGHIDFAFQQLQESDIPPGVVNRYTPTFVHWAFTENAASTVPWEPHK
ncbi:MAG TPA: metallophosphoesterase [Candidatus Xenobia bacterium]|jgi:hypothetical protein